MSNRLKVGKHLLLSCSALFPVLLAGIAPAGAQAVNLGGAGNLIVPDGRTGTNVSSNGSVTDIRTNTVRGQTGFNSFSKFEAGSGNTVNLHLPDGTGTLVNIVRDAPVRVEGTVNALKNGSIGGNVVFSDPYGFVLGKSGVINTGGLTVNTPTKEFLDQAIDAHGRIDTAKTDRLISGDVPLSPDGSVVIRGRVNAETHVDIHAQSIDVDGEAVLKRHRENFEATVNTAGGVSQGGALVVRNGRISLVAAGDVKIGGSVAARATSRESAKAGAGRVAIKARNVTVTPTARIEALVAIARDGGADAVAAAVGIEAAGALDIAGTIEARGLGGAGAAVNLAADRAAVKASALLSAQIEAGAVRGVVAVAAKGDIVLDGRIEARGAESVKGGRVDLLAGGDIAQNAGSAIDADGAGEGSVGGDVSIVASRDLAVADGARVSARGAREADGGFVELSGHRTVTLGAVDLDLRSDGAGKAGRLLIDPTDIVIANASTYVRGAVGSIIDNVGSVVLWATNSITVTSAGRVDAGILDVTMSASTIDVQSGGEVRGGTVLIEGKPVGLGGIALPVGSGSLVVAGRVVGGDVTLSAKDTLSLSGVVETRAVTGRTETVTIEGRDVTLGGRIEGGRVTVESSRQTFVGAATLVGLASVTVSGTVSAGDVTISALDKITLAQNGRIETRTVSVPTATTRAVTLTSREIDIQAGSAIASGTGDVTLLAEHVETVGFWEAKALAKITVAGSITGRNLTATARAVATSRPSSPTSEDPLALIGNSKVLTALGLLTGFNAGYMAADATAALTIASGASIDMSGDVKLAAEGTQSVANFGRNATFGKPMAISVFVGQINAKTSVDILDGAAVKAGGDLAVSARNDAVSKMKTQVRTINAPAAAPDGTGANAMDIAVAVSVNDIATSAIVHGGATIQARNLSIIADNTNTFSVVSKSDAAGKSLLGMAFAVQLSNTSAIARLGANYGTSAVPGGNVSVAAINNTILNLTKASAKVGGEPSAVGAALQKYAVPKLPGAKMLTGAIAKYGSWMGEVETSFVRGSISLALNVSEHVADASIGADVGKAAPAVVSSGNVAVVSSVYDAPIRNVSDATVAHTDEFNEEGKQIANAISVSAALVNHRSHATIGKGVSITAGNIGLSGTSDTPIFVGFRTTGINDLATPKEFLKTALNFIKVKGAVTDMIGTSYAGAQTKTKDEEVGLGASVNYLGLSNDTLAWVASDAVLNTTKAANGTVTLKDGTQADGWSITLDTGNRIRPFTPEEQYDNAVDVLGDFFADGVVNGAPPPPVMDTNARGSDKVRAFRSGVDLQASTVTESINIAGSPAWLVLKGGTQGGDDTASVGASGNLNFFASKTIAGIGAGASVTSAADVSVNARNRDTVYAISPSSGRGAGFGLTGLLSLVSIDNTTAASISNRATVSAKHVSVRSRQQTDMLSVSGALVDTSGTSIGVAATWTTIDAVTSAFIADNDTLVEGTAVANRAGAAAGRVTADAVTLDASTGGQIVSMSVAASLSRPEDGKPGIGSKVKQGAKDYLLEPAVGLIAGPLVNGANSSNKIKSLLSNKVMDQIGKLDKSLTKSPKPVKRDFTFAGAGSITGVDTQFDTQSYLDGANISRLAATGSVAVTVDATNDLLVSTTSGAASIALVGAESSGRSAAIAGAVAVAVSDNRATAAIRNSVLTEMGTTRVRAVGAGQQIVLGLGLAANTNANSAISIAGSVSFGFVFDNVNALIEGSTLTAAAGSTDKDLSVKAYQTTDIGIGGLAVSVATKGKGGFGLAMTGTVIADSADPTNPDNRKAVSALIHASTISNFRNLVVDAATLSRVMSGAGSVGVAPNGFGVTGSIVVNDISNTTRAAITGGGQSVATSGNVLVRSGSKREAEIVAELSPLVANRAIQSGFDFSEQVLDTDSAGAVIFAAAGSVGVGKNSVGVSLLYNGVRQTHESLVEGVTIAAGGDVSVLSADDTKLIGVAAGVSVATGQFGGAGSIVVQVVANKTAATVRGASTSVSGRAITVGAANASYIVAGAGAVGVSTQGAGLGLSLTNATVANDTDALVERATLTASGTADVSAVSSGQIVNFAVSVGVGNSVGVAGSVATSVALNDATARVRGATITAEDNVLVRALSTDSIHVAAGAVGVGLNAAGVGVSTAVNVVRGETVAVIESLSETVGGATVTTASTIVAKGIGAASTVDDGVVGTAYDYSNAANIAKTLVALTPNLANGTRSVSGLSVGAVSQQKVGTVSLAVGVSAQGIAGAVSPVVNVLGGKTEARIADARINQAASADGKAADVFVTASSNTFVQNAVLAAAGSATGAGAAGFVSNVMERKTFADVQNSAIGNANGSVGAVALRADATMDSVNLVAGLSVGSVGVAGSMVVNVFDAQTRAQLTRGTLRAASLGVAASTDTGFLGAAGSGAGGSTAVAGAMNVSVNLGSTHALVGEAGSATKIVLGGDLSADARSRDEQRTFVVGGSVAAGGGVAVAGMVNLSVLLSDTIAEVNGLTSDSSMDDVSVTAANRVALLPVTGGFSVSAEGVGVGAAANVMVTKSHVSASVINSAFTARGALDVKAFGERRIQMATATVGGGGTVGIGAAIGIVVAGIDMSGAAKRELGDTLGSVNDQSNQSLSTGDGGTADYRMDADAVPAGQGAGDPNALTRRNVAKSSIESAKRDEVVGRIEGGAITAGATTVLADSRLRIENIALGAGIGGAAGVGAAVGYTFVNQDVSATVSGTHSMRSLDVGALSGGLSGATLATGMGAVRDREVNGQNLLRDFSDGAVNVTAIAGAGSLIGAAGAAVAVAQLDSQVSARVGGSVTSSGLVSVKAVDDTSVRTNAIGAAVAGGVAIGISVAVSDRDATVSAQIADGGSVANASGVEVAAGSKGSAKSLAMAGAAGLLGAGVGASATSLDETAVLARLGTNASLTGIGAGGIAISASATPVVSSYSLGVALSGGGAVGASIAVSKLSGSVDAVVASGATLATAGNVTLAAELARAANGAADTTYARAIAGSGGYLFAAQASVAEARSSMRVSALVSENVRITNAQTVAVTAKTRSRQTSDVTGVAVGGLLALGASVAESVSGNDTTAELKSNVRVRAADLAIDADGEDRNDATSVAGSGGIIAGTAATATTTTTSTTRAVLGAGNGGEATAGTTDDGDVVLGGRLTVSATHLSFVGSAVNSLNASIAGASGAIAVNTVTSNVYATIGENARASVGNLTLSAKNRTQKLFQGEGVVDLTAGQPSFDGDTAAWTLNSGSGGLVDLPAGRSLMTVRHDTEASLGRNARVRLPQSAASSADLAAYNEIVVHDKAKLDSGGAIAVADTRTRLDVLANRASVAFGEGSSLVLANGNLRASAYDNAHIDLRAASTTYGLAGAPTGSADIDYRRTNTVAVGANALIQAESMNGAATGTVRLAAGAALDRTRSRIVAKATVDLFNKTAIPIPTVPNPTTRVSGDSTLTVAASTLTGRGVRAAGDINLVATRGNVDASAVGTGKDIYRESLAEVVNGIRTLFGQSDITFDYKGGTSSVSGLGLAKIDGIVETGIQRSRTLTLEYAKINTASCIVTAERCLIDKLPGEIDYTTRTVPVGTTIIDRLNELRALLSDYNSDPVARGAFAAEIAFLEAKLIAAGFSKDGTAGAAYSLSDREVAELELTGLALAIQQRYTLFGSNAAIVVAKGASVAGSAGTVHDNALTILNKIDALAATLEDVTAKLRAFDGYSGSTSDADLAAVGAAVTNIRTQRTAIATQNGIIDTKRGDIASARTAIGTLLQDIADDRTSIDAILGGRAFEALSQTDADRVATLQTGIATKQQTVRAHVQSIEEAQTSIDTAASTIAGRQTLLNAEIDAALSKQAAVRDRSGSATQKQAVSTKLGEVRTGKGEIDTGFTGVGTGRTGLSNANSNVDYKLIASSDYGTNATFADALDQLRSKRIDDVSRQSTLRIALPNQSTSKASPSTMEIQVADTVVRLGNIDIEADRLQGTGELVAPGNASIEINNRTANSLKIGRLEIASDTGGQIRLNGVLVNDNAEINARNENRTGASFANVATGRSGAGATISINNFYNSASKVYYDPALNPASPNYDSTKVVANQPIYLTQAAYAPDIVLDSNSRILNPGGSVSMFSEQGDILSGGRVEANSISIVARNGDFVQGYTYGFHHIAGDPQSGTPQGLGTIANGAVAISARYLNINGLIQSGMAERVVTIGSDPTLTVDRTLVSSLVAGKTTSALDAFDQAYRDAIIRNPPLAQSAIDALVRVEIKDANGAGTGVFYRVAKDGTPGRLEFSLSYRKANEGKFGAITKFALAEPSDRANAVRNAQQLGVDYDSVADQFEVNAAGVRGGHIQLYGQIMNTTADGSAQLRVLDGFGQIKIVNAGSQRFDGTGQRQVVLNNLDTGEDLGGTGRGVEGRIDITDIRNVVTELKTVGSQQQLVATGVTALKTEFRREVDWGASQTQGKLVYKIVQRRSIGTIGNDGAFTASASQTGYDAIVGADRIAGYDPQAGLRYLTLSGTDSATKTVTHYKGDQWFGSSDLQGAPTGRPQGTPQTYTLNAFQLRDAATVKIDTANVGTQELAPSSVTYDTGSTNYVKTKEWSTCNWWTLCIAGEYNYIVEATTPKTTITTRSTKADNRIGVEFVGSDAGLIDVQSAGDIILNGLLRNRAGTTKIVSTGGSIRQGDAGADVIARDITLTAAGSIGGLEAGKAVTVTQTGAMPLRLAKDTILSNGRLSSTVVAAKGLQLTRGDGTLVSTAAGVLNASVRAGNIALDARSNLNVGQITAGGDVLARQNRVVLKAGGSITGTSASLIQAARVDLSAASGSIGAVDAAGAATTLKVNTGFTSNAAERAFGDPAKGFVANRYFGLAASAPGDIRIASEAWAADAAKGWTGNSDGTILLDRVTSAGGDVRLVSTGFILDNNPDESIDTRTYNQLLAYWNTLGLQAGAQNDAKTAAVVKAFEDQVTGQNRVYRQLLQLSGGAYDSGFRYTMTDAQRAAFADSLRAADAQKRQAAIDGQVQSFEAALRASQPLLADSEVGARVAAQRLVAAGDYDARMSRTVADETAAYEASQTKRYHETNAVLKTLGGTFDASGVYTASAGEQAARKQGSAWTDRELILSLSPGALKTITGTNPVIKLANVSGQTVSLQAQKGLGEAAAAVTIDANFDVRTLSDAQKIALVTAERSDFVTPNAGEIVRIQPKRMLNFDAATRLDVSLSASGANAYLATLNDARLGAISAPGELRVKARGSIVNAAGGLDVSAGSYILEASGGGIGYRTALDGTPVAGTLRIKPVNTGAATLGYKGAIIARASDAIDLEVAQDANLAESGDANLDTVYSRKSVKVVADKSIRNANGDRRINILGDTAFLEAKGGSIGSADNRLNVGNGLAGWLDATSTGSIHLFAPDGQHLTLNDVIARGGLLSVVAGDAASLVSSADLTLKGSISASTSIDLKATGRLAALGGAHVTANGGDIFADAKAMRMLTGATVTASGKIAVNATGDALVTGIKAGSSAADAVRVTAGGRILAGTTAGRTDIETTGADGGVVLTAGTGIGSAHVKNDDLTKTDETAVLNPLRLKTGKAELRTDSGDLAVRFLGDIDAVIRNGAGSIDVGAAGRFTSTFVGADRGAVRIGSEGALSIATLNAGRAQLTSGGALTVGTGTIADAAVFDSAGALDFSDLTAGSASLRAGGPLTGGRLATVGDATLRSDDAIGLAEAKAGGTFAADAAGDLGIDTLTAGAVRLGASGSIRVLDATADTSIAADAGGGLTLRRGVSGGTQRLASTGDLVFDSLRTLGIATDPGDIYLTSREGAVLGGEVIANRDLFIDAKKSLVFSELKSVRDMSLTVGGALKGPDLDAGGELFLNVAGDSPIRLATLRSKMLKMSGAGPLTIDNAIVSEGATLEAPSITIGTLTYTGLDQLLLTLRGYRGAVANDAAMRILAPNGIRIDQLRVADSRFATNASNVQVIDGYVPGTLELRTPDRTVWMNNRTPRPTLGNDVQLYRPDFTFGMDQSGNRTTTTSYIVRYGSGTDARMVWNGEVYPGSSFVRDFERAMQDASNDRSAGGLSQRSLTRMTVDAVMNFFRRALTGPVSAPLDGPAVRTSDDGDGDRREAAAR